MSVVTPTAFRVSSNTPAWLNQKIRKETDARVKRLAAQGTDAIEQRLHALEHEWDIERCLETGAASLSLLGIGLGAAVDRKWFLLPAGVAAFLLQHALQGWCPPLPVFRRLGVRTADEINEERNQLKALIGQRRFDEPYH